MKKTYDQKVQDAIKSGWRVCFTCPTHTTLYRNGKEKRIKKLEIEMKKKYDQKVQDAIKSGWSVGFTCPSHTTLYRNGKAKIITVGV